MQMLQSSIIVYDLYFEVEFKILMLKLNILQHLMKIKILCNSYSIENSFLNDWLVLAFFLLSFFNFVF